jgi:hypothetical protein
MHHPIGLRANKMVIDYFTCYYEPQTKVKESLLLVANSVVQFERPSATERIDDYVHKWMERQLHVDIVTIFKSTPIVRITLNVAYC